MSNMNLNTATASQMESRVAEFTVDAKQTDGVLGMEETVWQNFNWTKQWGYFNAVPDLKSAILMKAIWNVGKGYTTEDQQTQVILDYIRGWGKDTFDDILFNMEVIKRVGGDSYAEIIRDSKTDTLINLKPLDPGSIRIVVNKEGRIIRYEQLSKTPNISPLKFQPKDILHFSNNRLADQIHGISDIDALEKTILADEENFTDMRKVMHRQAKPMIMFKIGTDDQTQINSFISKMDAATNKGENIYVPNDTNTVEYEVVQVNVSQVILEWRNDLRNKFYRTIGLPQVVPGAGGQSTESESKVIYLAFEQIVEKEQRQIEKQLWQQLLIKIDLYPPASIMQDLNSDASKDGAQQQLNIQASDTQAGVGR